MVHLLCNVHCDQYSVHLYVQAPPLPDGTTTVRFRVQYDTEGSFPRVRYAYSRTEITVQNLTLSSLVRDTEYTIQVRAETRYRYCYSYLYGNNSEPLTVSTNATRELCDAQEGHLIHVHA